VALVQVAFTEGQELRHYVLHYRQAHGPSKTPAQEGKGWSGKGPGFAGLDGGGIQGMDLREKGQAELAKAMLEAMPMDLGPTKDGTKKQRARKG
jgi:hypothetical protein